MFSPIMVNWALPPDLRSSATVPPPPWVYVPSTFDFEPQLTTPKTSNASLSTFAIVGKKELFVWCSDFVKARTFVRCAAFCQATLFRTLGMGRVSERVDRAGRRRVASVGCDGPSRRQFTADSP